MTGLMAAMCGHAMNHVTRVNQEMHPGWLPAQSEVQFIDVHLPLSHVDMLYVTFAYTLLISPTTKGVMSIRRVHQILST